MKSIGEDMEFSFHELYFKIIEDKVCLVKTLNNQKAYDDYHEKLGGFVEVQVAGENKDSHFGSKMIRSSEGNRLKYVSHKIDGDTLTIVQKSDLIKVETVFKGFCDTNTVSVYTEVFNMAKEPIVLEGVSAFKFMGLAGGAHKTKDTYLYKFTQSHQGECQPRKFNLYDMGLFCLAPVSSKRVNGVNIGSWSTKEELPQGIVEYEGNFTMFQIESNNSWYYEISDYDEQLYLYLGGANSQFGGWSKRLNPNEGYKTVSVAICYGNSINAVLGEMTKYRRHIKGLCRADEGLPTIFNEYMHLSWDSPTEENTKKVAPIVAKAGINYYVIDCGWHNEEKGSEIYPYVGQWKESHARFPNGVKATTDYIRSLGMKAGLWIEPEIVGYKCKEMLEYYDDECFIRRYGKKVLTMGRYFLDFRNKKVYDYMSETIRRMVEDYGADYIKMDYNEDLGIGTDVDSDSFGEGLEQCSIAYLKWIEDIKKRFPNVLFETCSSGGNRLDYETLRHFSIVSTSDQTEYKKYPYIAGNILAGVLPEQAAVWSYPVDSFGVPNSKFNPNEKWVEENVTSEQVIMNMINSFLGRMHLASHIELLSSEKFGLVKEGVEYFKGLTEIKKKALPYLPNGFTDFRQDTVISGLRYDKKVYLAVWNLGGKRKKQVSLDDKISNARITYPNCKNDNSKLKVKGNKLIVELPEEYSARFIEIELK